MIGYVYIIINKIKENTETSITFNEVLAFEFFIIRELKKTEIKILTPRRTLSKLRNVLFKYINIIRPLFLLILPTIYKNFRLSITN